jgi:hypothetical protein
MVMTRDEAIELQQNANWKKLVKELDTIIVADQEKLLNAPVEDMVKLQEKIKAYRLLTRMPAIIAEREEV